MAHASDYNAALYRDIDHECAAMKRREAEARQAEKLLRLAPRRWIDHTHPKDDD